MKRLLVLTSIFSLFLCFVIFSIQRTVALNDGMWMNGLSVEALKKKVLTVTTVAAAQAMTKGIEAFKRDKLKVKALQDYYKS
jgi:hypothetical protein